MNRFHNVSISIAVLIMAIASIMIAAFSKLHAEVLPFQSNQVALSQVTTPAKVPAQFNECVDLVSVVWKLMGAKEYNLCLIPSYAEDIDNTFSAYKEHPVVKLARGYYQSGIAYDAVAAYGLHLQISPSGEITLRDGFKEGGDSSFDRWSPKQKEDFLKPLNDFYRESNFHSWYMSTEPLRKNAIKAFTELNKSVDYSWFESFFGPQQGSQFSIVLSILIGPNNYGCSAILSDGSNYLTPVIGCCAMDDNDQVIYNANAVLPIIIHEFCHHYCNPLNEKHWDAIAKKAEEVFKFKKAELTKQAYPSAEIMMNETFVRASVISYMVAHFPNADVQKLINNEEDKGFMLTQTIFEALTQYSKQRDSYPTMEDYMPQYAKAVNSYSVSAYKKQQANIKKRSATYKVSIRDGAKNIPSGDYTITLHFSKPMVPNIAFNPSSKGTAFPKFKEYNWPDSQTLNVTFTLEPNHQYGLTVLGKYYNTVDGGTAGKTTEINFTTGE